MKTKIAATVSIVILVVGMLPSTNARAQARPISAQEYIQSTSPLADGGSVTSRTAPGQKIQTITTIAQLPPVSSARAPVAGYQPRYSNNDVASGSGNSSFAGNGTTNGSYSYPTPSATLNTGSSYSAYRQINTLGTGPTANTVPQLAQNCPTCVGGQSYSPPTYSNYQAPTYNNSVPNLNIQVPQQPVPQLNYGAVPSQPNFQYQPNVGTPQYGAQGANWWTPFVSGSGVYTPLIRLRNMPPGTYLGQGVIGQPTAYVDGQPVRNLVRYISP